MPKFVEVEEFKKDLRKFKFDIEEDFERFKKALAVDPQNLNGAVKISNLGAGILPVYKARKFRCKVLKKGSQSGIRVVYTYNQKTDEIILIEIYFKSKKENHDLYRIRKYTIKSL